MPRKAPVNILGPADQFEYPASIVIALGEDCKGAIAKYRNPLYRTGYKEKTRPLPTSIVEAYPKAVEFLMEELAIVNARRRAAGIPEDDSVYPRLHARMWRNLINRYHRDAGFEEFMRLNFER